MYDPPPMLLRVCVYTIHLLHIMPRVYRRETVRTGNLVRNCPIHVIVHLYILYLYTYSSIIRNNIMYCVITIIAYNGPKFSMFAHGIKMINNHN